MVPMRQISLAVALVLLPGVTEVWAESAHVQVQAPMGALPDSTPAAHSPKLLPYNTAADQAPANSAVPGTAQTVLTLQAALDQAVAVNPGVARLRMEAEARAAVPSQAGSLPDPWVSAEPGRGSGARLRLGITQDLPAPGKLSLRRQAAEHEAEAAQLDVGETALQLSAEVKQGWWRLFFLDRALEIVCRNQDVLRQTVQVAETRYRVGEGLQQDVLLAQLELSKLLEMEIEWAGERRVAEARLNTLLYRSPATPIVLPASVEETLPAVPAEELLIQQAQTARPALTAQRRQVDAANSQLGLARRDYWPDFSVGANHEWWSGEKDFTSVVFAMSVPLHTGARQDRAVDERGAELLAQRYALQDAAAQVAADVAVARSDYQRARHHTELYKTSLLPQAAQTVAAMLAGYQVGKVDFLNLAQAQMTLNDYETRYWQSLSEAQEALARLSAAVGKEIIHE